MKLQEMSHGNESDMVLIIKDNHYNYAKMLELCPADEDTMEEF